MSGERSAFGFRYTFVAHTFSDISFVRPSPSKPDITPYNIDDSDSSLLRVVPVLQRLKWPRHANRFSRVYVTVVGTVWADNMTARRRRIFMIVKIKKENHRLATERWIFVGWVGQ